MAPGKVAVFREIFPVCRETLPVYPETLVGKATVYKSIDLLEPLPCKAFGVWYTVDNRTSESFEVWVELNTKKTKSLRCSVDAKQA
jgi:hypothetical protein